MFSEIIMDTNALLALQIKMILNSARVFLLDPCKKLFLFRSLFRSRVFFIVAELLLLPIQVITRASVSLVNLHVVQEKYQKSNGGT